MQNYVFSTNNQMNGTKEKLYAVQTFASEKAIIYETKKYTLLKYALHLQHRILI